MTIPEELRQLIEANEILLAGLRAVEVHHVEMNARAGRDEAQSVTLRIVREALAKSGRAREVAMERHTNFGKGNGK